VCWAVLLGAGVVAATQLPSVLVNSFTVPGSESERAANVLAAHFGERPESTFVVVFAVPHSGNPGVTQRLQRRLDRAARAVPTARAQELHAGAGILYGNVVTRLDLHGAESQTERLRAALHGGSPAFVTGQPAIEHDLDPVLASDLRRGELVAISVALLVLVALFGLSPAVLVPFAFAACTIAASLLGIYLVAHGLATTSYVTNLAVLIGFGLAVDYSLLLLHRYREELERGIARDGAVARTVATAGRTVVFSGTAVAIALGLLLVIPVPFVRSLGAAALLVPLISTAGALTLGPVLLALVPPTALVRTGSRGLGDARWLRFAQGVVRRRGVLLGVSVALLVLLAAPLPWLRLVPGSFAGIPAHVEAARGLELLRTGVGPGAVTPTQVVVDGGSAGSTQAGPARAAIRRLSNELFHDSEVYVVASGTAAPYTAPGGRYARLFVVGRHEYGAEQSQQLVHRLRDRYVPAARFPAGVTVAAGGAPPQGVDFLSATYGSFPWLVLAVLAVTYVMLLLAFRSLLLPLQAIVTNVLTVAAVCGLLVAVFHSIDAWVPIFLFAALFGLSMDYEVFLVMRMRESWDRDHDTDRAVVHGVARTGRVITAAAVVMAAAVSGFVAGDVPGLRELGLGLAVAILLDATVVRLLLVPSLVSLTGNRAWYLPPTSRP
jgi:RND superfamily putative drug exporter